MIPNTKFSSNLREINVGIKIDGSDFGHMLEETAARADSLEPWLRSAWVPFVRELFMDQLETQGGAMGVGSLWAVDYSPKYKKNKERDYAWSADTKEVMSGKMFGSLVLRNTDSIEIVGPHGAVVGTKAISDRGALYPGVQQSEYPDSMRGTPTRLGKKTGKRKKRPSEMEGQKRKIPPRPPWGHFKKRWEQSSGISLLTYISTGRIEAISR
jgi:hypothetical protein